MKIYNKLVRDKIPEIIEKDNKKYEIEYLDDEKYRTSLLNKLDEEVAEFKSDMNIEELADIIEVVAALSENLGYDFETLLAVRNKKLQNRGGFAKKIFLKYTE